MAVLLTKPARYSSFAYLLPCIVIALVLNGCALDVVESSGLEGGKPFRRYYSNSLCGVFSFEDSVGLYVEQRGGMPNRGDLDVWAYNIGKSEATVELKSLKPFSLDPSKLKTLQLAPNASGQLIEMPISMPYYSAVPIVIAEVSFAGITRTGKIVLKRKEHSGYWDAVLHGCDRPKSVQEFANAAKAR